MAHILDLKSGLGMKLIRVSWSEGGVRLECFYKPSTHAELVWGNTLNYEEVKQLIQALKEAAGL